MTINAKSFCRAVALVLILGLFFPACKPQARNRPPGYIRIAPVWDLARPATIIDRSALLVRFDEEGFSVMSTLSTFDLSRLVQRNTEEGVQWVSMSDSSVFADDGTVLHGPAVAPLPYFELALDRGTLSSTFADTLFARIGRRRPPTYRFMVPEELLQPPRPQPAPPAAQPLQPEG